MKEALIKAEKENRESQSNDFIPVVVPSILSNDSAGMSLSTYERTDNGWLIVTNDQEIELFDDGSYQITR